ncbi:MAG: hypothetical protein R6W73_06735 [Candidatus Saliniplasma sp.]
MNNSLQVKINKERLENLDTKGEIKPGAVITARCIVEEYEDKYSL